MDAVSWIFAAAFIATQILLVIAVDAHSDLANENRELRRQLATAKRHPSLRVAGTDGGAA